MGFQNANFIRELLRDNWAYPTRIAWENADLAADASETITQASHGFSFGGWIYDNAGTWTTTAGTPLPEAVVVGVDSTSQFTISKPWIRYTDFGGTATDRPLGCDRTFGTVQVSVFTPQGFGPALSEMYADAVRTIMSRAIPGGGHRLQPASLRIGPELTGSAWFHQIVEVPYIRDEAA